MTGTRYSSGTALRRRRITRRLFRAFAAFAISASLVAAGFAAGHVTRQHVHVLYPPDCQEDEVFTWQHSAEAQFPSVDWRCVALDDLPR